MIWNAMLWYDVRSYHICCLIIDDLDASWIHSLPKRAVRQVSARTGKDGSLMEATDLQVEKHGSFDKILKPGYQKWTCVTVFYYQWRFQWFFFHLDMWDPLEIAWNLGSSSSPSVISSMPRISSDPSHLGLTHSLLWFILVLPTKKNRYWIPKKIHVGFWNSMTHNYAPCCWNMEYLSTFAQHSDQPNAGEYTSTMVRIWVTIHVPIDLGKL